MRALETRFGVVGCVLSVVLVGGGCGTKSATDQPLAGAGSAGQAGVTSQGGSNATAGGGAGAASGGSAGSALGGGGVGGVGGSSAGSAGSGGSADAAGSGGSGGAAPTSFVLPAYTASAAKLSTNMGTRNAGHQFTVTGDAVVVRDLGMYDSNADGLKAAHTVTLFSVDQLGMGAQATPVPGGTATVPAGKAALLEGGFRYTALPAPITLEPGNYAVIAYGLGADDLPGDGGGLPLPATGVTDEKFDPYEFVSAASPAYPSGGDPNLHANASLRFESKVKPLRIMPFGASITDGFLGTQAGYRGPLKQLFDDAQVPFQFVGSWTDNPGTAPLPREQQHHEGHPGFVIIGGTSGRAGIYDSRDAWLGPTGSQADIFLIVIGTNDVDLDYQLDTAGERLDALIDAILEPTTGLQPKAKVVLAQLPPINDAAEDARCVKYNATIAATVVAHQKKGQAITTVDLHAAITTAELADKLHPSDVGYTKIAKVFFDAIQKL